MKETREIIILLNYTENATLIQTLNGASPTAQRLALSLRAYRDPTKPFFHRKGTSCVHKLPTGQHSGRALYEDVIQYIYVCFFRGGM